RHLVEPAEDVQGRQWNPDPLQQRRDQRVAHEAGDDRVEQHDHRETLREPHQAALADGAGAQIDRDAQQENGKQRQEEAAGVEEDSPEGEPRTLFGPAAENSDTRTQQQRKEQRHQDRRGDDTELEVELGAGQPSGEDQPQLANPYEKDVHEPASECQWSLVTPSWRRQGAGTYYHRQAIVREAG